NVSNVRNESAHLAFTSGVRSSLPKWRIDFKFVKPFFERCQQVFIADNVDPTYWVRLLLRAVEDVNESAWVKSNLVDKNLTWEQAQDAFSQHFEMYSHSTQLVKDY